MLGDETFPAILVPTRRAGTLTSAPQSIFIQKSKVFTAQELPFPTGVALLPVSPTCPCISHHQWLPESIDGEATPSPQGSARGDRHGLTLQFRYPTPSDEGTSHSESVEVGGSSVATPSFLEAKQDIWLDQAVAG